MTFRIDYFANGERVAAVPCPVTLSEARALAQIWLPRFGADKAEIRDVQQNSKLIEVVKR